MRKIALFFIFILSLFLHFPFAEVIQVNVKSCGKDIDEIKKENLKKAKREASERIVGTVVESRDVIWKGKLTSSIIRTFSKAYVKVVERSERRLFREGEGICIEEVITLEVKPEISPRKTFGLRILLPKKTFKKGEEFSLKIYTEEHCFPYVFISDSEENVYRIFPNRFEDTRKIRGILEIPTEKMKRNGIVLIAYPKHEEDYEEVLVVCLSEKSEELKAMFIEPYVQSVKEIEEFLRKSLHVKTESLLRLLEQIGTDKFELRIEGYVIVNE